MATLVLINVADGSITEIGSQKWAFIDDIVWHPTGDSLLMIAADDLLFQGQVWEVAYPAGAGRRLTNNLNGHYSISVTADGSSIVVGEVYSRSAIWVSPDVNPENAKSVMSATADTWGLGWTPDGRIVFASDQTGEPEIWIMDADGSNARALTSDRALKSVPVMSSDGRYIVYSTARGADR